MLNWSHHGWTSKPLPGVSFTNWRQVPSTRRTQHVMLYEEIQNPSILSIIDESAGSQILHDLVGLFLASAE